MSEQLKPCPFCGGEGVIYEYSTVETCQCSIRPAQPAEAEGVEPVEFWVLFDATTPERYIKKMMPEGFLAFFDHEEDAIRAKTFQPGTDYKRVPYVRESDHLAALSAVTAERDRLREENERLRRAAQTNWNEFANSVGELDQLRAEVEASRLLLEQCNEVIAEDGGVYIELRAFLAGTMQASDVIALLRDAAMAAKEA